MKFYKDNKANWFVKGTVDEMTPLVSKEVMCPSKNGEQRVRITRHVFTFPDGNAIYAFDDLDKPARSAKKEYKCRHCGKDPFKAAAATTPREQTLDEIGF